VQQILLISQRHNPLNKSTQAAIIPGFSQIVIQLSKPEEKLELQPDTRLTVSFPGFAFVTLK
jgi:hypothetical protein